MRGLAAFALVASLAAGLGVAARADAPGSSCMEPGWIEDLWPKADSVVFRDTTLEERAAFGELIPGLLEEATRAQRPSQRWIDRAKAVDFVLEVKATERDTFWVLRERPDRRRGAGAYVLRTGAATTDVVQAPHAYFDEGSGALAATLFACAPDGRKPRVFMSNTAHRYRGRPGEQRSDPEHRADVAHNPDHLFTRVTELLAQRLPGMRVLQLHGFGAGEERDGLAAVVSPGERTVSPWVRQVSTRLSPVLGEGVRRFPDEATVLGGTRNAQARVLQAYAGTRFLHLELSSHARQALRDAAAAQRAAAALFAPGPEPEEE